VFKAFAEKIIKHVSKVEGCSDWISEWKLTLCMLQPTWNVFIGNGYMSTLDLNGLGLNYRL